MAVIVAGFLTLVRHSRNLGGKVDVSDHSSLCVPKLDGGLDGGYNFRLLPFVGLQDDVLWMLYGVPAAEWAYGQHFYPWVSWLPLQQQPLQLKILRYRFVVGGAPFRRPSLRSYDDDRVSELRWQEVRCRQSISTTCISWQATRMWISVASVATGVALTCNAPSLLGC
jgi:hypothetical protein